MSAASAAWYQKERDSRGYPLNGKPSNGKRVVKVVTQQLRTTYTPANDPNAF